MLIARKDDISLTVCYKLDENKNYNNDDDRRSHKKSQVDMEIDYKHSPDYN